MGIPLSNEAGRGVGKVMKVLGRKHWKVRWEPEEKWHVTLAFIGDVLESQEIQEVQKIVGRIVKDQRRFELGFKGLGAFPDLLLPKIVWIGLNGDLKSLYKLAREIRDQLENSGIQFVDNKLMPHVTLGRVKHKAGRKERLEMGKEIKKMIRMDIPQRWVVERVVLFKSVLTPKGSEYQELVSCKLR